MYAVCALGIVALFVLRPQPSAPASVAPDARAAERALALEARVNELGRDIERANAANADSRLGLEAAADGAHEPREVL